MAITTVKYATSIATGTPGDTDWTSASNAAGSSDATAAACSLAADEFTYTLKATGYDFSEIPDGSTIDEITATVRRKRGTEGGRPIDEVVDLVVGGALDSQSKPEGNYWSTTIETKTYTWSDGVDTMPSAAEVKASDFGIGLQAVEGFADAVTANLYWIGIQIEYTAPAGGMVAYGDIEIGGITVDGTAPMDMTASGDLEIGGITVAGVSAPETIASGDIPIGGVTVAGVVRMDMTASGDLALPGLTLDGTSGAVDGEGAAGSLPLGGVTVTGQAYTSTPATISGDSVPVYLTGAADDGGQQNDPRDSTGGFRSSKRARSMTWDTLDPMIGIEILEVSGYNGRGVGALSAAAANKLQWRGPVDSDAGAAVTIAVSAEAVIPSDSPGAWIRVRRSGDVDLSGTHSVRVLDIYNDVIGFEDVPNAEAVSGATDEIAVMFRNEAAGWFRDFRFWIDTANTAPIAIAVETPTAGELQASPSTGLTWSTATTRNTGIVAGALEADEMMGLRIKRTTPADAAPAGTMLVAVNYSYDDYAGTRYTGQLRGRYRVVRDSVVGYGVWVGAGAAPDLTADPDETFTSFPHTTTTLSLANDETYQVVVRKRNKWGLWSQNITPAIVEVNSGGTAVDGRPDAPSNVVLSQNSDNEARVAAVYDAGSDDYPAAMLVVWVDDAAPDGSGTPSGYQLVPRDVAYYDLAFTDTGVDWLDGTPIYALVRSRRLIGTGGDTFAPDMIQLDDSSTGSLKVSEELAGWGSSGYGRTVRVTGELLEVWSYSAVTVGTGETTITVNARGLLGTTPVATSAFIRCEPITWVDSDNTDTVTYTIVETAPGRPGGELLLGDRAAVYQTAAAGPDGVTPVVIDAGNSHELLLGEGWASLYMGSALVWRFIWDTGAPERNGFYVPSEWTITNAAVSGSAVDSGVWDSVDANTLYLCAGGVRRVKIDLAGLEITVATLNDEQAMPERITQAGTLEQFAGALLLSWDPGTEEYAVVAQLTGAGVLNVLPVLDNSLAQSAVEAL